MRTRTLGKDGPEISEVGLGCWQFGGDFGEMNEATAFSIMESAVENGITFFDTANVYGAGRSESLIGQFRKNYSGPLTVATKAVNKFSILPGLYTRDALRDAVQGSLERLQMDAIDLLQLHCIPLKVLENGHIFDWLRELKQEGLILEFGASVESINEGLICMEQPELRSLQVIFNIFRQRIVDELLPIAKERGVGIIARLPLASGLLSGKYTKDTVFAETDHRHYNRDGEKFHVGETFAGLPFEKGVELADALKPYIPEGMTMAQMAQRWILDHEAISAIIPGASSPKHIQSNAIASELTPLSPILYDILNAFYCTEVHDHIRGEY